MTADRARRILLASLVLGIAGDLLFFDTEMRLGFAIWVALVVVVALWLGVDSASTDTRARRERAGLLALAALAAAGLVVRDAETLFAFDFLLALGAAALVVWRARGRSLAAIRIGDGPVAAYAAALSTSAGALMLSTRDAETAEVAPGRRQTRLAVLGALAALPVLAIVAALLGEADPMFGAALQAISDFVAEDLVRHIVVPIVLAWVVAGWMRGTLVPLGPSPAGPIAPPRVAMAALAPLLYALVALLTAFLALQVRALFGGVAFVEAAAGLSYAEYARSGFFQLVAVAFIVFAALLVADAMLDRSEPAGERSLRTVSGVLLVLVGVLAASAVQRMALYVGFYGLSESRIYALAGMAWIVAALAWFGGSVLRGRRERFAAGLLALTAVWVLALNLLDPDALVARVNLARAQDGASFDVKYHAERSADAVPVLVAGATAIEPAACRELLTLLRARWVGRSGPGADWRSWSVRRSTTVSLLSAPHDELVRRHCRGP